MHRLAPLLLLTLALMASACDTSNKSNASTPPTTAEHPNIVLIVADDLGWADPAYMGNAIYHTPNLDRLSERCVKFTQAYLQAYRKTGAESRDPLFRTRPGSSMRAGKWKLHEYFEDGGLELYDLTADPGERDDLAPTLPTVRDSLHRLLVKWRERTNAPVPTETNPAFDAAAMAAAARKAS